MNARVTALLAEDEPLLAQSLQRMLAQHWPELDIVATAGDGISATALALQHLPDLLFLDIRMPGKTGLEVAEEVLDDWPNAWPAPGAQTRPAPLVVFVTAYEEFALAAFERQAADYILKPATSERLLKTIVNLKQRLAERHRVPAVHDLAALLSQVQSLRHPAPVSAEAPLETLHLGIGNSVRLVPLTDILYCEAGEKYLNVVSTRGEGLIRMSLRELLTRAQPGTLVQVHRSIAVNQKRVLAATRDDAGHLSLMLQDSARPIPVSRAFAHLFRAM